MNHPSAFIPRDRLQSIFDRKQLPENAEGSVLFADMVGYTTLIQSIVENEGTVSGGVSEVERLINRVFELLIAEVHKYGGYVVAFGGDAITAWFPDDEGIVAIACAETMQYHISQQPQAEIAGKKIISSIKISIASGLVQRLMLGNTQIQLLDALTGEAMLRLAQATCCAEKDKIIVAKETAEKLDGRIEILGRSSKKNSDGTNETHAIVRGVATALKATVPVFEEQLCTGDMSLGKLRPWLLEPIYNRLNQAKMGSNPLSAEIRLVVVLFLKFADVKAEKKPIKTSRIKEYVGAAQHTLHHYHGSLIKVTFDDKGSYLLATFGAPYITADADSANQALSAALALRKLTDTGLFSKEIQIGISLGRMLVGPFGSPARAAYDLLGIETNIANRLMDKAGKNEILVSARAQEMTDKRFNFGKSQEIPKLKGVEKSIDASLLLGEKDFGDKIVHVPHWIGSALLLIGREAELEKLLEWRALAFEGYGSFVLVEGEAGIGKSHLVAEFGTQTIKAGAVSAWGSCASTHTITPYYVWKQVLRSLIAGLPKQDAQSEQLVVRLEKLLEQTQTIPLSLTDRYAHQAILAEQTVSLINELSNHKPLFLVFDNTQWIDESSRHLLTAVGRSLESMHVMIMLILRPTQNEGKGNADRPDQDIQTWCELLAQIAPVETLELGSLTKEDISILVDETLNEDGVSRLIREICWKLSSGNPLYVTELIDLLSVRTLIQYQIGSNQWDVSKDLLDRLNQHNCLEFDIEQNETILASDAVLSERVLNIPDKLYSLVQARIDQIPGACKETFHLACVIGPAFEISLLEEAHPEFAEDTLVHKQIEILVDNNMIVATGSSSNEVYSFVRAITQEVAYNNLHQDNKRNYHKYVGDALEKVEPDSLRRLAYHYNLSGEQEKQLYYLDLAARESQNESANQTALSLYNQALDVEERVEWLQGKVEVLDILGERREQASTLAKLSRYRELPQFELNYLYGRYHTSISDYQAAAEFCTQAIENAIEDSDSVSHAMGLALQSQIKRHLGDIETALEYAEKGLEILGATNDDEQRIQISADLHNRIGDAYRRQNKNELAKEYAQKALNKAKPLKDRRRAAQALNILAAMAYRERAIGQAEEYAQEIIRLQRSTGDLAGEGLSLNNLGLSAYESSEYSLAVTHLEEALKIFKVTKEIPGEIDARSILGMLDYDLGDFGSAYAHLEACIDLCEEIGDKEGQAYCSCNLGIVLRDDEARSNRAATQPLQSGITYAKTIGNPHLEAICLSHLALVQLKEGELDDAIASSERAKDLFLNIGLEEMTTINLSTMAAAYQQGGKTQKALASVDDTLFLLAKCDDQGPEYPHWDYFHCADILFAHGDMGRAKDAISAAHQLLMQRAENFQNTTKRNAFLTVNPMNARIVEMYQLHFGQ